MVAHALLLHAVWLGRCLAGVPVSRSGACRMRRLWHVVMLVLVRVVVPEIGPAIFPRFSPVAILRRAIRWTLLRALLLSLLIASRSSAPAMPPVGSLLASRPVCLRRLRRPVDPRDILAEQFFDGLDRLDIVWRHQRRCEALASRASRASDTVHIILRVD